MGSSRSGSPRRNDAATRGPARDDDVLRLRTASRRGHVDWAKDDELVTYLDPSGALPGMDAKSVAWRVAAADAAASAASTEMGDFATGEDEDDLWDGASPSRADLLKLVVRLQDQVSTARQRQDELSTCLRTREAKVDEQAASASVSR